MGFYGCIPRFIKNHASWILTALGLGGMAATVILTAKAAPSVHEEICCASYKDCDYADDKGYGTIIPRQLSFGEKFEIAAPKYLPAFLTGVASAGCFIGAQIINGKQQAALIAAYGLLAQEFNGYRSEVKDEIGVERERQIFQANRQKMLAMQEENKRLRGSCDVQTYMITTLPNVTFNLKPGQLEKALYNFLIKYMDCGAASLSDLYEDIGIPKTAWDENYEDEADDYGWEDYENEVSWGSICVDFAIRQVHLQNEKTINLVCPTIPPYKLGLKYGYGDSSCDNLYRNSFVDYDDIERWLNSIEGQTTVFADPPELYPH